MSCKIVTDLEGFKNLEEDWRKLECRMAGLSYYSTFRFNYFWWETYAVHHNHKLFIICSYRDNQLTGIAPLMIRTSKRKWLNCQTLCFIGKGDYFNFIVDSSRHSPLSIIKEMFGVIEDHADQWTKVELSHIAMDTELMHFLLRHDRYNHHVSYLTSCPRIDLSLYTCLSHFERAAMSSRIKRKLEKLKKEHHYRFKVTAGMEKGDLYDLFSGIHRLEKQYLQEQKGRTDRKSIFDDKNNEAFFRTLFHNNPHVVAMYMETDNHEIIAYQLCYFFNNTFYGWNTGYSPEFVKFGVFDVLMLETMNYLFEHHPTSLFDLGAGSYSWKYRWTSDFMVNYSFKMWNSAIKKTRIFKLAEKARRFVQIFQKKSHSFTS
ncbi:GNAT family N-acetyltransferase [Paenibacillus sp. VCA1]|uniref:GNAT family N-acetyltransferase n=1 Tax=Paenibacillus sp. VCA1 TaxID=3039148 RepID=UPI002870D1EA|nr:GNAT family N-acetyltransferase [Paenibacillus sp. VCA1]MDR9854408.1 GNAT family N-acetyltransferase [Paenibacillus sp. VCA1]